MLKRLKNSLENASVVQRGKYRYFQHPFTDGAPAIDPQLLGETCKAISKIIDTDVDLILTVEATGIHVAASLSQFIGVPFNFVRKTPRYLPGELVLDQSTGYSKGELYLNVNEGERVLVVDTVISTGGTMCAVIKGLRARNCKLTDAICVIERGEGKKKVKKETGVEVKTLVKIKVEDKVKVIEDYFTRGNAGCGREFDKSFAFC